MNLFEIVGMTTIIWAIIFVMFAAIKTFKGHKVLRKQETRSSFDLDIKDKNLETKYKNLDMKSFNEIAGLKEVKEELKKYVKCFDCVDEFKAQNTQIPRGVLLWGPPGCGKTSLAKAIAYEAHVNFISRNASNLIQSKPFLLEGSDAIEQLFIDARKKAPCIVFIDELDVIGYRYNEFGTPGVHQVEVTKLLAEMDGFQANEGIMVIGATNDITKIDKALLRSGRFGKKYYVGPPESKEDVMEVVEMYKKGKSLDESLTSDVMTSIFNGMAPADIKEALNSCAVMSIMNNAKITAEMLRQSILELKLDTNLKNKSYMDSNRRMEIARHEAAHTVVARALNVPVDTVTILGTSTGIQGLTDLETVFSCEDTGRGVDIHATIRGLISNMIISYAGLCIELVDGSDMIDLDFGSAADIEQASMLAVELYKKFFIYNGTPINTDKLKSCIDTYKIVGNKPIDLLNFCKDTSEQIVKMNLQVVGKLARELTDRITISGDALDNIVKDVKSFKLEYKF